MLFVIMAGGVGTRFWPRSREKHPKQVLKMFTDRTLIQETVQRIAPLASQDSIYIISNGVQTPQIKSLLPELRDANLLEEPFGKNTAPAIGLSAIRLKKRDPDSVMVVLPADHTIQNVEEFRSVLQSGVEAAERHDSLVTIGIRPTYPSTGYGYIQQNGKLEELGGHAIYRVKTFAEKPEQETAIRFVESGEFLWNSGMFIWRVSQILGEIEEHLPELYDGLLEIERYLDTPNEAEVISRVYHQTRSISIDFGVMENASDVLVIEGDFGWSDIGSWEEVYRLADKDAQGNVAVGKVVTKQARRCYVDSPEKLVALVDVEDLVVVDTKDALLICRRDSTQMVKDVVEMMKRKKLNEYL